MLTISKRKYKQAIADFNKAISLDPTNPYFYGNRATTYFQTRDFKAEKADLNRALQCDPKMASAYNDLAWSFATCPEATSLNGTRAIEYATKACEMTEWKNGDFIDTLAAAYAESGQFQEAIKREQQALEFLKLESKINAGRARLSLHQSRMPYREDKREVANPGPIVPPPTP